ncbi:MAG: rod-binding protein [Porphyrobacter sp.]|nr:rod-binding protein [Porphyrobacter sp.]
MTGPIAPTPAPSPAPSSAPGGQQSLREAARQFEAIFLRQLLATARAADFGDGADLFGGAGEETFAEMRDAHFADLAAGSDMIGLATAIEAQLARFAPAEG